MHTVIREGNEEANYIRTPRTYLVAEAHVEQLIGGVTHDEQVGPSIFRSRGVAWLVEGVRDKIHCRAPIVTIFFTPHVTT